MKNSKRISRKPTPLKNSSEIRPGPRFACGKRAAGAKPEKTDVAPAPRQGPGNREGLLMLSRDRKTRQLDETAIVDEAIVSRRSVRAFLPEQIDDVTIRDILDVAARAPSGTNMQPWRVYVTKGEGKQRITDAVMNSGIRAEKAKWDEY